MGVDLMLRGYRRCAAGRDVDAFPRERDFELYLVRPRSYHSAMGNVVKKSHSFEPDLYAQLATGAAEAGISGSTALSEAWRGGDDPRS